MNEFTDFVQISREKLFRLENIQTVGYSKIFRKPFGHLHTSIDCNDDRPLFVFEIPFTLPEQRFRRRC